MAASVYSFDAVGGSQSGGFIARFLAKGSDEGIRTVQFVQPRAVKVGVPVPEIVDVGETRMIEHSSSHEGGADGSEMDISYILMERAEGDRWGKSRMQIVGI